MKPFPPGRLSTTSCWRQVFASFSPTRRSAESGPLPVGNGVSTRTGFAGYVCAKGVPAISQLVNNEASAARVNFTLAPELTYQSIIHCERGGSSAQGRQEAGSRLFEIIALPRYSARRPKQLRGGGFMKRVASIFALIAFSLLIAACASTSG